VTKGTPLTVAAALEPARQVGGDLYEVLRPADDRVFVALGEPDEIIDATNQAASGVRYIRWEYMSLRLALVFQDETGFGEYRLTPLSRSEYQRVLARVRRG